MSEMNVRQPSPEEITRRLVRKEQASQERYLNLERLAKAAERLGDLLEDQNRALWKLVAVLQHPEDEPRKKKVKGGKVHKNHVEAVEVNEAGLPVPPWIDEPSTETVEYPRD